MYNEKEQLKIFLLAEGRMLASRSAVQPSQISTWHVPHPSTKTGGFFDHSGVSRGSVCFGTGMWSWWLTEGRQLKLRASYILLCFCCVSCTSVIFLFLHPINQSKNQLRYQESTFVYVAFLIFLCLIPLLAVRECASYSNLYRNSRHPISDWRRVYSSKIRIICKFLSEFKASDIWLTSRYRWALQIPDP